MVVYQQRDTPLRGFIGRDIENEKQPDESGCF
jgi:hypothetical protein